MSEWGIEQPSSFGNVGGCFVEGLSLVGGIAVIVAILTLARPEKNGKTQNTQPNIEHVKSDTNIIPCDTVMFVPNATAIKVPQQYHEKQR